MKTPNSIIILTLILSVSSCSRVVKEEAYLSAHQSRPLTSAEDLDLPNSSQQLRIPDTGTGSSDLSPDTKPPEKAFAKRRSEDENVIILDLDGKPTIELYNDRDAWDLINKSHGANWVLTSADPDNCKVNLHFDDPIFEKQEAQGFFKRLFHFKGSYIDRSGDYLLTCLKLPQKQQIWLQTADFQAPSSYATDDLFEHIFKAATE